MIALSVPRIRGAPYGSSECSCVNSSAASRTTEFVGFCFWNYPTIHGTPIERQRDVYYREAYRIYDKFVSMGALTTELLHLIIYTENEWSIITIPSMNDRDTRRCLLKHRVFVFYNIREWFQSTGSKIPRIASIDRDCHPPAARGQWFASLLNYSRSVNYTDLSWNHDPYRPKSTSFAIREEKTSVVWEWSKHSVPNFYIFPFNMHRVIQTEKQRRSSSRKLAKDPVR